MWEVFEVSEGDGGAAASLSSGAFEGGRANGEKLSCQAESSSGSDLSRLPQMFCFDPFSEEALSEA